MNKEYQHRVIEEKLLELADQYPVLTITGPRQSGKTTLCKNMFPDKDYISLENIDVRTRIKNDPNAFIEAVSKKGIIIDEVQRYPDLLSYIQTAVDENDISGQFILTGSQNFSLLSSVSQSLAGRTALLTLLPYSLSEIYSKKELEQLSIDSLLFKGFYPRIFSKKLDPSEAMSYYLSLYVERDVRQLISVKNLSLFQTFLKICASLNGQIVNLSQISNDVGVSVNTVKSWLSVLESSYIIYLLKPHYNNFKKRLTKSPKLYFLDSALVLSLLGVQSVEQLHVHPLKGHLFEAFIVAELIKQSYHNNKKPEFYYFRDNVGNEVDLLIEKGSQVQAIEIKSSQTMNDSFLKGLKYYQKLNSNTVNSTVIYGGKDSFKQKEFSIKGYRKIANFLVQ